MNFKKTIQYAIAPTVATSGSAGYDLYCADTGCDIEPGETVSVHTGICMEIPKNYVGLAFPRSGLSTKHGIRLANCAGVIDSDYRGEIMVPLHNDSKVKYHVCFGDRLAQIVIVPCVVDELTEVAELSGTERGEKGFGSTGV